jgi:hypothetical protein
MNINNIIIVANHTSLKIRIDKLAYFFYEYIKQNSKYNVLLYEPDDEKNISFYKNKKDTVLIVFTCTPSYIKNYTNIKIYYIEDVCCTCPLHCNGTNSQCKFQNQKKYIINNNFNYVWYKYHTPITIELNKTLNNLCYYFPHMLFDPNIHKNYNLEKKYDILLFGKTISKIYPFRNRLYHLLNKNANKFNIKIIGYNKKNIISGIGLYKLISQSWLCVATSSINNLALSKYFEIGLCGSVVIGDCPYFDETNIIENNMVNIDMHMTDEQIINTIEISLLNKEQLHTYSNNIMKHMNDNYMMKNGLNKFEDLISIITDE